MFFYRIQGRGLNASSGTENMPLDVRSHKHSTKNLGRLHTLAWEHQNYSRVVAVAVFAFDVTVAVVVLHG